MARLDEEAKVKVICRRIAENLKEHREEVYAHRVDETHCKFTTAWDGLYPDAAVADLVMHSYEWELLREIPLEELIKLLEADCAEARKLREQLEAKTHAAAHGGLH